MLPVTEYPSISPPNIQVRGVYPGASAEVVQATVGTPIEDAVNGVEDMIYMSSKSANDGSYRLTVTFEVGTDLDMANILVQNRVTLAEPKLPEEVKRQGVNTKKKSTAFLLFIALTSPDGRYDEKYIGNYANLYILDALKRVPGANQAQIMGLPDLAMRLWLQPDQPVSVRGRKRGVAHKHITSGG